MKLLKSLVWDFFASRNQFLIELTPKPSMQSLLQKLHPVRAGKELIRLGPNGDGGYLVPDDLAGIEACFSPGVSMISGFEKACAERGMKVFMADKSVDKPADSHALFHFTKKFVGASTYVDYVTMDHWVDSSLPKSGSDLLLQIDIEFSEYETFLNVSDPLMSRFRIIVAEFHYLEGLWALPFFYLASRTFEKILQTHACVHIHPNNCKPPLDKWGFSMPAVAEFTFVRRDRQGESAHVTTFPHPLDFDNTANPHFALPKCWYANP